MEILHDRVTAGVVLTLAALVGALAAAFVVARRPSARRVAAGVVCGLMATAISALGASTGMSGTLVRTRRGLPHFFAVSNSDPVTGAVVDPLRGIPAYLVLDVAFWCAVSLLVAALVTEPPASE